MPVVIGWLLSLHLWLYRGCGEGNKTRICKPIKKYGGLQVYGMDQRAATGRSPAGNDNPPPPIIGIFNDVLNQNPIIAAVAAGCCVPPAARLGRWGSAGGLLGRLVSEEQVGRGGGKTGVRSRDRCIDYSLTAYRLFREHRVPENRWGTFSFSNPKIMSKPWEKLHSLQIVWFDFAITDFLT